METALYLDSEFIEFLAISAHVLWVNSVAANTYVSLSIDNLQTLGWFILNSSP